MPRTARSRTAPTSTRKRLEKSQRKALKDTRSSGSKVGDATEQVLAKASEILGNKNKALRWMGTPIRALDFATPISLLGTQRGIVRVNRVLGRWHTGFGEHLIVYRIYRAA